VDEIEREAELTKARVLELNAAMLEIACLRMLTYEELKAAILQVASDGRSMCAAIRERCEGFERN
jgi:hypothetical protein